jgi:clan AA aspartic protease (TIGR02281 family)
LAGAVRCGHRTRKSCEAISAAAEDYPKPKVGEWAATRPIVIPGRAYRDTDKNGNPTIRTKGEPGPGAVDLSGGEWIAKHELRPPLRAENGDRVRMIESGGTYHVPVVINDALKLNFIIDSGASDVSIPSDVVLTLIRTGTIKKSDFIGTETYSLADGSAVSSRTFIIRSLKVGDRTVTDVRASMADVNGSLLLGQSFLKRFRSWSQDNAAHELVLQ